MSWNISDRFPSWGETGAFPAAGFFYEGGDQVNEKHMDALWNGLNNFENEVQAALADIDSDSDGVVDRANQIVASYVGDGLDGGNATGLSVDVSDFAGHGVEDDGSQNLRLDAGALGVGIAGGDGTNLSLDESVIKDGGQKEIDAAELGGSSGNDGEVLTNQNGDGAAWQANTATESALVYDLMDIGGF